LPLGYNAPAIEFFALGVLLFVIMKHVKLIDIVYQLLRQPTAYTGAQCIVSKMAFQLQVILLGLIYKLNTNKLGFFLNEEF
jgi:hypothetical protein